MRICIPSLFNFYSGRGSVLYKYYKQLQMHVAIACIITMYGNTEATPFVHGCHGNFICFISGHIKETEYDVV